MKRRQKNTLMNCLEFLKTKLFGVEIILNYPLINVLLFGIKGQPEGISFAMAEYAWASFDKVAQIFKHRTQGQEQRFHPTQKPVALYKWLLLNYAKQGDKILDTHLGSGSIAIAIDSVNKIEKTGLTLTACELDKEYFDAAIKRIENATRQDTLF